MEGIAARFSASTPGIESSRIHRESNPRIESQKIQRPTFRHKAPRKPFPRRTAIRVGPIRHRRQDGAWRAWARGSRIGSPIAKAVVSRRTLFASSGTELVQSTQTPVEREGRPLILRDATSATGRGSEPEGIDDAGKPGTAPTGLPGASWAPFSLPAYGDSRLASRTRTGIRPEISGLRRGVPCGSSREGYPNVAKRR